MPKPLLHPEEAVAALTRRFEREHAVWLVQGADDVASRWPLTLGLAMPTERELSADAAAVRGWAQAWAAWPHAQQVLWQTRQWPRLGEQHLPATLVMPTPQSVADAVGQGARWRRAAQRLASLQTACPALCKLPPRQRVFDALADHSGADFECLRALLTWAQDNPASGLRLRQLPVAGLHTKWVQAHHGLITDLVGALRGPPAARDLLALLGLSASPVRLRMRLLCPRLRGEVGGLGDIEAPLQELAALPFMQPMAPARVLIVENLETGLALPDIEGCVALMKLGHAVGLVQQLPWLKHASRTVYWGDIDTHGFAILNKARAVVPRISSVLMDEATLAQFAHLCVPESQPHPRDALAHLTPAEHAALQGLAQRRLEQERLPWPHALTQVLHALDG
jgi:hypothetical protein